MCIRIKITGHTLFYKKKYMVWGASKFTVDSCGRTNVSDRCAFKCCTVNIGTEAVKHEFPVGYTHHTVGGLIALSLNLLTFYSII